MLGLGLTLTLNTDLGDIHRPSGTKTLLPWQTWRGILVGLGLGLKGAGGGRSHFDGFD